MKVIVAGSRSIRDYMLVLEAIERNGFPIKTLIHGGAQGVDFLAGEYASARLVVAGSV